jgi:hypothetical protein
MGALFILLPTRKAICNPAQNTTGMAKGLASISIIP